MYPQDKLLKTFLGGHRPTSIRHFWRGYVFKNFSEVWKSVKIELEKEQEHGEGDDDEEEEKKEQEEEGVQEK